MKDGKAAATSKEALAEQIRTLPAVLYTKSTAPKTAENILRKKGTVEERERVSW